MTEQLHGALQAPKVDEAAVCGLSASQAMDLEKQVKTAHLTLMIRVKNLLTADQQEKARALAAAARGEDRPRAPPASGLGLRCAGAIRASTTNEFLRSPVTISGLTSSSASSPSRSPTSLRQAQQGLLEELRDRPASLRARRPGGG